MGGLRVSASRLKVKESSGLRRTAAEGDNEDDSNIEEDGDDRAHDDERLENTNYYAAVIIPTSAGIVSSAVREQQCRCLSALG